MPTFKTVTIQTKSGQLWAAAMIQRAINFRNAPIDKAPPPLPYDACFLGSIALNTYFMIWQCRDLMAEERKLLVPSDHLTLDVLLSAHSEAEDVQETRSVTERIVEIAADGLLPNYFHGCVRPRGRELLEFFCPRVQAFPVSSSATLVAHHAHFDTEKPHNFLETTPSGTDFPMEEDSVRFNIAHPALFFIRVLERIQLETRMLSATGVTHSNRTLHIHRRSAQVFLLRLFVELVEETGHSDPAHSDALWRPRLRSALPAFCTTLEIFTSEIGHVLRRSEIALQQAHWQVSLEGSSHGDHRLGELLVRNERAFKTALDWLLRPNTTGVEPPSYQPPPPAPHTPVESISALILRSSND